VSYSKLDLPPLIGIVGAHTAGKTTLAAALARDHGFFRLPFSQALKEMLLPLGLSRDDVDGSSAQRNQPHPKLGGKTPRFALEALGVNWGRTLISPDLWVNALRDRIEASRRGGHRIVVDDVRFENEWQMLLEKRAVLVRVRREGAETKRRIGDHIYHRCRVGAVRSALTMFGWRPIKATEYHWWDAPYQLEVWNDVPEAEFVSRAMTALAAETN
jgi:hypothetical protein